MVKMPWGYTEVFIQKTIDKVMMARMEKKCVPCRGDIPALKGAELKKQVEDLGCDWQGCGRASP